MKNQHLSKFLIGYGLLQGLVPLVTSYFIYDRLPRDFYDMTSIPFSWALAIFPIIGVFFSLLIIKKWRLKGFGPIHGLILSVLFFIVFCVVASLVQITTMTMEQGIVYMLETKLIISIPIVNIFLGGLLAGWVFLSQGLVLGMLYRVINR